MDHVLRQELEQICTKYDIRGIAGETLREEHARAIGQGFARWCTDTGRLDNGWIIIGRDCRESGPALTEAFIEGASGAGANVIDIGLASTDMLYAASGVHGAPGVMITASHNPAHYNGMKLTGPWAEPLSKEHGIRDILDTASRGTWRGGNKGRITKTDFLGRFVELVLAEIDTSSLAGTKVAVDAGNGMGGLMAPAVLEAAGIKFDILYGDLDGRFPNHPANPLDYDNLRDLQQYISRDNYWAGIAFDGDADRAFFIDAHGKPVPGSTTTSIVAQSMLRKNPGSTILYNLICSRNVRETIEAAGGVAVRTPVGHSLIKRIMAETGAVFGGEHSAHYYFKTFWRADSGILAVLHTMQNLVEAGTSLHEVRANYEPYIASGEINHKVDDVAGVLATIEAEWSRNVVDTLDGISLDCGPWWGNIRGSNTEPLLRVNIEAENPENLQKGIDSISATIKETQDRRKA